MLSFQFGCASDWCVIGVIHLPGSPLCIQWHIKTIHSLPYHFEIMWRARTSTNRASHTALLMQAQKRNVQYFSLLHFICLIFILFMTVYQFITHNITHQTTLHTQTLTARWCVGRNFTEESSLCGSRAWSTLHRRNKVSRNLIVCLFKQTLCFTCCMKTMKNKTKKILYFPVGCYSCDLPVSLCLFLSLVVSRFSFRLFSLFSQYNKFVHDLEYSSGQYKI